MKSEFYYGESARRKFESFSRLQLLKPVDRIFAISLVRESADNVLGLHSSAAESIFLPHFGEGNVVMEGLVRREHSLLGVAEVAKRLHLEKGENASYLSAATYYFLTAEAVLAKVPNKNKGQAYRDLSDKINSVRDIQTKVHSYTNITPEQKQQLDIWALIASLPWAARQERLSDPKLHRKKTRMQSRINEIESQTSDLLRKAEKFLARQATIVYEALPETIEDQSFGIDREELLTRLGFKRRLR